MLTVEPPGPSVAPDPSSDVTPSPSTWRTKWFVRIACLMAIALFFVMAGLIYSGWGGGDDPAGLVVVQGNAATADATVTLSGVALRVPLTSVFSDGIDNRIRFHVPPGAYRLKINRRSVLLYSNEQVIVELVPVYIRPFPANDPLPQSPPTPPTSHSPAGLS